MPNESPYNSKTFGAAAFVAFLVLFLLCGLGLFLWMLTMLFTTTPLIGFLLVLGVLTFVGLAFLVQYLDAKHGWFDLDSF